jgi:aminoglycoside phosphotransferase (APT) family kinase protein
VAKEPAAFLGLGLCSAAWLDDSIATLVAAEARAPLAGDSLVHLDVRSDNISFVDRRPVLVDWGWACRGNAAVDVAAWLPSLHLEGGPPPETILPRAPELAALMSGFFADRAGLPGAGHMLRIRALQRAQLGVALPWAVAALGLRPLDGAEARR